MRGDTLAVRDRVLATLRDAERPVDTLEVCVRAGAYLVTVEARDWHHRDGYDQRLLSCVDGVHLMAYPLTFGNRGYNVLRQLENMGVVRRHTSGGRRAVAWSLTNDTADHGLALLESWLDDAPSA